MNIAEKKQSRIERYNALARQAEHKSIQAFECSNHAVAGIPFGQPILVGHHSESRHRAALQRSHAAMDRMVAEGDKAEYYRHKAQAAQNNHAIYTEAEDAVEKLEQKITALEKLQTQMKAANKIVRSTKLTDEQKIARMCDELGFLTEAAEELLRPDYCGRIGFPNFSLTNNNATLRTAKKRLEHVRSLRSQENKEYEVNGVRVVESYTDNRFQIFFGYKPDQTTRRGLKSVGYRWSPSNDCWQCHINGHSIRAGKEILESLAPRP